MIIGESMGGNAEDEATACDSGKSGRRYYNLTAASRKQLGQGISAQAGATLALERVNARR